MATLGLKEMGKFLWEGREKGGKRREKGRARITRLKRLILGSRKKIINLDYRLDRLDRLDRLEKLDRLI